VRDASGKSSSRYAAPECWASLEVALNEQGLNATETAMVMGGNMWRVARQVWR
jgi:microsomal dipeptidase-like Zn-dependent dipeptidase